MNEFLAEFVDHIFPLGQSRMHKLSNDNNPDFVLFFITQLFRNVIVCNNAILPDSLFCVLFYCIAILHLPLCHHRIRIVLHFVSQHAL